MKINRFLILFSSLIALIYSSFFFLSCSGSRILDENQKDVSDGCLSIHILDSKDNKITGRPYDIVSFDLDDNCLHTVVRYSGGCSIPQVKVNLIKIENEFYPKQARLDLVISDDDVCRELITDSISIDLSYLNAMARDGGILIRFDKQQKDFFYALPLR
ncbi:MAG: hypothetical protein PHG67_03645 [Bacteroidales bacterium]|nr:hypothetical protein [Bacteroidales bacterium]HOI32929.1 hypothetical protein [Bacteroidales bacterium]